MIDRPEQTVLQHSVEDPPPGALPEGAMAVVLTVAYHDSGDDLEAPHNHVTAKYVGAQDRDDFLFMAQVLNASSRVVQENTEMFVNEREKAAFRGIVGGLEGPEEKDDEVSVTVSEMVSWGEMSDLDRALLLDYLTTYRASAGESSSAPIEGLDLTYVDSVPLREMEPLQTHLHALFLDKIFQVRDLLRDDEVAKYAQILADHDAES